MLGYFTLLSLFLLLFSLCFLFGVREWLHPRDATPLPVDPEYVRAENFFGASFRTKMRDWLSTSRPLPMAKACSVFLRAVLERPEGGKILLMAKDCLLEAGSNGHSEWGKSGDAIFCEGALRVAPGAEVRSEIYAQGNVQTGEGARIVALASDGSVLLGADNAAERWVDALGTILVGRGTVAGGRLSSAVSIGLEPGITAESLSAPLIVTNGYSGEDSDGDSRENESPNEPEVVSVAEKVAAVRALPQVARMAGAASWQRGVAGGATSVQLSPETELVRGNLEIPDGARVQGSLVVQGTLRSGVGARFGGSIKASRVELGPRNSVKANVVSGSMLSIGQESRVEGSAVADRDIVLQRGARVGADKRESVVSAGRDVTLEENVAVRGKIAAGRAVVTV